MELGTNLRRLRQQSGMTQAALAEALGVSDRAVSRWERGTACPDITLLPQLAMLLHVSADALLGVDEIQRQETIDQALAQCSDAMQSGDPARAEPFLRTALSAYPNEPELMVALARLLLAQHTEDAAREALSLCRMADGRPARLSTQYGCKQVMALALHRLAREGQAFALVEKEMPAIFVSRELLLPRVASPELARKLRCSNVTLLTHYLTDTLRRLAKDTGDDCYSRCAAQIQAEIEAVMASGL